MDGLDKLFAVDLDTPAFRGRPAEGQRERLLGLREIAAYLNVGRSWLIAHIKSGDLVAYRVGTNWRVSRLELQRFLMSNRSDRIARGRLGTVLGEDNK
jgi:excisionase family DNA binding protein